MSIIFVKTIADRSAAMQAVININDRLLRTGNLFIFNNHCDVTVQGVHVCA